MRVAVMSDIHGFNLALETVIADLDAEAARDPIAEVIVAGDLCEDGPGPAETLTLLRARGYRLLRGNTDQELVEQSLNSSGGAMARYALDKIGADGVKMLAALPFDYRLTPPGGSSPADDLLVVHANPHNVDDKLLPEASDRALRDVIGETRAAVIAFGHHHVCYTRRLDDLLLVDVSAAGNPKDGDLRCTYGLLTWDEQTHRWDAEIRRLDYPIDATTDQIRASDLPDPEATLRKLLRASY
jgi:predicted phosphodiesterase